MICKKGQRTQKHLHSRNHVMSKNALSWERIINYVARRGIVEVLREFILEKVRFLIWVFHFWVWHQWLLLHLDAEYLCLSHCKLHLKLRNLVLQMGYGSNTTIHRVPNSCMCFIHQTTHSIPSLVSRKFLKQLIHLYILEFGFESNSISKTSSRNESCVLLILFWSFY